MKTLSKPEKLIIKYLKDKNKEIKEITSYHPSKFGSECLRELFYYQKGTQPDYFPPLTSILAGYIGTGIHKVLPELFQKSGIMKEGAKDIDIKDTKLNIHGYIDVEFEIDGEVNLAEIKSVKHKEFYYVSKEPRRKDVIQLNIYLHNRKVKNGWLIYIDRNEGEWVWHNIEYNPALYEEVERKINYISECVKENKIPDRPFDLTYWACGYCPYKFSCRGTSVWRDYYNELKKEKKSFKKKKSLDYLIRGADEFDRRTK